MALPTSRSELIEYSLRQLGKPVINIEITEEQSDDNVDYALEKFVDRHYDGQTEILMLKVLTKTDIANGYVKMPAEFESALEILKPSSSWSIEPFDSIEYYTMWDYTFGYGSGTGTMSNYYITMQHLALINMMMGKDNTFFYNTISRRLQFTNSQTHVGSSNLFEYYQDLENAVWTKLNCTCTDKDSDIPNGDLVASTVTSDAAGVFGISQGKETDNYVRGCHSTEIILKAGTYTGDINIIMEDRDGNQVATKTVPLISSWVKFDLTGEFSSPNINDVVVRFETATAAAGAGETFHVWSPSLYVNNFIVIHGYAKIDTETFEDVWHEEWLMKYVTALQKRQWGHNTKKYQGVQLPGGVETTGQVIFDEANAELDKLDEQFSMEYELPVDFFFG